MQQSLLFSLMAYALPFAALSAPIYSIDRIGLIDAEHTRDDGYQSSYVSDQNESGQLIGRSNRYDGNSAVGYSTWQSTNGTSERIGFTGSEYTRSDGYQSSFAREQNEAGQVVGFSSRYSSQAFNGQSAWQATSGIATRLGFYDDDHTSSSGYQYSTGYRQNEAGQVLGNSLRFAGDQHAGRTAWQSTGGVSLRLGLTDAEHTRADGAQASSALYQNEVGQVIGYSNRYIGQQYMGQSAWQSTGGVTTRLGFIDSQHARSDGYKSSSAILQNEQGQVIGLSARYNGLQYAGQTAWQSTGGVVQRLGFTDAQHTRSDGYQWSEVSSLNELGQVVGQSQSFNGTNVFGSTAWQVSNGATTRIGLLDAEHTSSTGVQSSVVHSQNQSGQVVGSSSRFDGFTSYGESVWQYSDGVTTRIGLTDGLHTSAYGYHRSSISHQNESGQVIGYSESFNGSSVGQSAWQAVDGVTTRIGLFDGEHTAGNGYQGTQLVQQNALGQVVGYSHRYDGSDFKGRTAWFYDDDLDLTFEFDLLGFDASVYEYSQFLWLDDSGFGLGQYQDASGSRRAFGFSLDDLFFDLGDSVLDGLNANGWDELSFADLFNASGQIAGYGDVSSDIQGVFQLTRVSEVPEPSSLAVLGFGALLVGVVRRRKSLTV